jgi:hypothetical protein
MNTRSLEYAGTGGIQQHEVLWIIEAYERFINEISKDNPEKDKILRNFIGLKDEILKNNSNFGVEEFEGWVEGQKNYFKDKIKNSMNIELGSIKKTNLGRIDKKSRIRLFQRICLFSYKREEIEQFFESLRVLDQNEILEESMRNNLNFGRKQERPILSKVENIENIEELLPQPSGIIKFFCKREGKYNFRILKHSASHAKPQSSPAAKNNTSKFIHRILTNFFICLIERKSSTYKEIMNLLSDLINITTH